MDDTAINVGTRTAASLRAESVPWLYLQLTKPKQTALLMATGIGAYLMSAAGPFDWLPFTAGMAALAAAISGSTALNMVIDRDIDATMARPARRPIPAGALSPGRALAFALVLSAAGLATAWSLSALFGTAVTAGLVFDAGVYS